MLRRATSHASPRLTSRTPRVASRLPTRRHYSTEAENVIFEVNRAGRVDELRRAIAAQPVERLPLGDFKKMAEKAGLSSQEATEALTALHRTGAVLYLPSEVPDVVFTRPDVVRTAILNAIDPTGELAKARTAQLHADLAKLEAELVPLEKKQAELQQKAARSAKRWAWFGAVYLTLQGAAVARLTWWEFSWDIMEPISYLLSFSTCVIGAFYFAMTRSDYSYENAWDRFVKRKASKLARRRGLDLKKIEASRAKIDELREQLAALGGAGKAAGSAA